MNKILTTFILGNEDLFIKDIRDEVEIIRFNKLEDIFNARGSYISFVDSEDNISDDYLEPNYECNICKDTGYISYKDKT